MITQSAISVSVTLAAIVAIKKFNAYSGCIGCRDSRWRRTVPRFDMVYTPA